MHAKETKKFQAETKEVLDLMVHSVYTNKEIFLRELVSNASDAIDKIKFNSLTNLDLLEGDTDFEIWLRIDEATNTISITDNGIGMTYEEVIDNIGTIAKSGTKNFLQLIKDQETASSDMDLIGQFGVGFYSVFMVSEKVTLETKVSGAEKGVCWESSGDGTYTIEEIDRNKRGTTITLTIREEYRQTEKPEENFLNRYTIQNLIKKYSDYIRYPIKMDFYQEITPKDDDGKAIEGADPEIQVDTKTLNSMVPLWVRNKKEISSEEYFQFYKNMFHDWNETAKVIHVKVEGLVEYTALLFIPSKAPYDFYSREYSKGVKLYSRHVFVMDNCQELLPEHFKFVRGLVDSADFSLNISREILQHGKQLKIIGKNIEKEILKTLQNMLTGEREEYEKFWNEFGKAIKGGIYMDYKNKEKLQDLLLFPSSHSLEGLTTLEEYVKRMPKTQKEIFFVAGKDRETVERLPQMEILQEKGLEVLYFFDKIDEFVIDSVHEYQEKKFKSVSRGDLKLDDKETESEEQEKDASKDNPENEGLLKAIKENLNNKVTDVKLSNRLKSSAVCLVSSDSGISLTMEQILKEANQPMGKATRILEINPHHEIFKTLKKIYTANPKATLFKEYAELLYDQASLIEGFTLENPVDFANRIANLMVVAQNNS